MNAGSRKRWTAIAICAFIASLGIAVWVHKYRHSPPRKVVSGPGSNVEKVQKTAKEQLNRPGNKPIECSVLPYTGTAPLPAADGPSDEEDIRGGMNCAFRVNDSTAPFTLHFIGKPDNTLGDIEVSQGGKVIQTIAGHEVDLHALSPPQLDAEASAVDANFDGYQDLELLSDCGATGNCSYDFYLYHPAQNKFVHNEFLSGLTTPTFDPTKKQVTTIGNTSPYDWESSTYEFRNGEYEEIKRVESNDSGVNVYELKDGKMVLTDSSKREDE